MKKFLGRFLVCFVAMTLVASMAFGQEQTVHKKSGPRRQLATIIFAGIGGAILGLSTLSFYGRPQDQLSNIAIGFAVGIIGGTVYVTFRSATTHDYYDEQKKDGTVPGVNGGAFISPRELRSLDLRVDADDLVAEDGEDGGGSELNSTTHLAWAPLVQKSQAPATGFTSLGGQLIYSF